MALRRYGRVVVRAWVSTSQRTREQELSESSPAVFSGAQVLCDDAAPTRRAIAPRVAIAALLVATVLAGCAAPAPGATPPTGDVGEPRLASAEDAYRAAQSAARGLDASARLVAAEPAPRGFPVLAADGLAPAWAFTFQLAVDPANLEPRPQFSVVTVNATTGGVRHESPEGDVRVSSRAPDGRAFIDGAWRGSGDVARALRALGVADPVSLALRPDGCPTERAAPAWVARAPPTGTGARTVVVSAATGEACRDVVEPPGAAAVTLQLDVVEADARRDGEPAVVTLRAASPESDPEVLAVAATSIPGLDGALPWGLAVAFEPATLLTSSDAPAEGHVRVAANASAEPGRYTLFVYGRDEAGRATAGYAALAVRVR